MTIKARTKPCATCSGPIHERYKQTEKEWAAAKYCSPSCASRRSDRFTNIFDRLAARQIKRDGCWGWDVSTDGAGYGTISNRLGSGHSPEKAHRVSYERENGPIPRGLVVCHKCDNPGCTNPDHLFLGTQKDNMRDCSEKRRLSKVSLLNLRHEFALGGDQVKEISRIKFVGKNGRGNGRTVKDVAREYGVCEDLIRDVKYNRYKGQQA